MGKSNTKPQVHRTPEIVRTEIGEIGKGMKKQFVDVLGKGGGEEFFREIMGNALGLGPASSPEANKKPDGPLTLKDPKTGEIQVFNRENHQGEGAKKKSPEKPQSRAEAAMNYGGEIKKASETAMKKNMQEKKRDIEQIRSELQQVTKALGMEAQTKFAPDTLGYVPQKVGKYHEGFFQGLLKAATVKKEETKDAKTWLNVAKKKGAGFKANVNLSDERTQKNSAG